MITFSIFWPLFFCIKKRENKNATVLSKQMNMQGFVKFEKGFKRQQLGKESTPKISINLAAALAAWAGKKKDIGRLSPISLTQEWPKQKMPRNTDIEKHRSLLRKEEE